METEIKNIQQAITELIESGTGSSPSRIPHFFQRGRSGLFLLTGEQVRTWGQTIRDDNARIFPRVLGAATNFSGEMALAERTSQQTLSLTAFNRTEGNSPIFTYKLTLPPCAYEFKTFNYGPRTTSDVRTGRVPQNQITGTLTLLEDVKRHYLV